MFGFVPTAANAIRNAPSGGGSVTASASVDATAPGGVSATAPASRPLRIGEVAARLGTTPRTIRYYEEIGLLPPSPGRPSGAQRCYDEAEVARIEEIMRLKELLGLSLDEVRGVIEAEEARRLLRERFIRTADAGEQSTILVDALEHIERQLDLVGQRRAKLSEFERELAAKRRKVQRLLRELEEKS
jgi:DNA-binding transcriptional MerR regulator